MVLSARLKFEISSAFRYERVFAILADPKYVSVMRKVVDFGCAECKFLGRLKGLPRAREIFGVDVDATLLESFVTVSSLMLFLSQILPDLCKDPRNKRFMCLG